MGRVAASHRPSCARNIRQDGEEQGWTAGRIAVAIRDHCCVTPLRAHRLARDWTLKEASDRLRTIAEETGRRSPRVDAIQLGHWETRDHQPRSATVALLADLYECSAQDLGFAGPTAQHPVRQLSYGASRSHEWVGIDRLGDRADAVRRTVDRTLAAASVSPAQLDLFDERVLWVRSQYIRTPPEPMLAVLLEHLDEVNELAVDRQPAAVQARLSELTAVLATLIADSLMKLGNLSRSRAWYNTARGAADDSGSKELRARVRAQAAMLPFYYGPVEAAVALAREARMIARGRATGTTAFAAAAEARARAKLGDAEGAQAAIQHAQAIFEQADEAAEDDAFTFPLRRLLLYTSGTYTELGPTSQARRVQAEALALYPEGAGIDPTLLRLEAAIGLARDRSPAEACELAGQTYLEMLPAHRTPLVEERAREVIHRLPTAIRGSRAVRELGEILELSPGQR